MTIAYNNLRPVWEAEGYVRISNAVPYFYVLRYANWRQGLNHPSADVLKHHQTVWDIRSLPGVCAAFTEILNTPSIRAVLNPPEGAEVLGMLCIHRQGSRLSLAGLKHSGVVETSLAELIIIDQRRYRITVQEESHWLPLGYIPADAEYPGRIEQHDQTTPEGLTSQVYLTGLGRRLLGIPPDMHQV